MDQQGLLLLEGDHKLLVDFLMDALRNAFMLSASAPLAFGCIWLCLRRRLLGLFLVTAFAVCSLRWAVLSGGDGGGGLVRTESRHAAVEWPMPSTSGEAIP